ncbi:MAG TPA: SAM-dependent methyltransferase [Thermoanaerobaculia bacterium]|nr:SAM-dependent methyltransferase [Thermoanaerobaculia bacterium]
MTAPVIRNISDTAAWVAIFRAMETERSEPLFRDPYARRLAGKRGEEIMEKVGRAKSHAWSYTMRTYLVDQLVEQEIRNGADMVVNLAAGLDARPYRMKLPESLQWVEIDLPPLLEYKEQNLRNETPVCRLRRIPLDLADVAARRPLFAELGRSARRIMVISEGLIVYLGADEACALARDLTAAPAFQRWATDLINPRLLEMLRKQVGSDLENAGAPLKFAPAEGPDFFIPCGWRPVEVRSMFREAANLKRLPFPLNLFAFLPDAKPGGKQPWGGICLLGRISPS